MVGKAGIVEMQYFRMTELLADITVDYTHEKIKVCVYTDDPIYMPFGIKRNPDFYDYKIFLESRCFPKERHNAKQLLIDLDVPYYEPFYIVQKTHGLMHEDYCWIRFNGEDVQYENIKIRD